MNRPVRFASPSALVQGGAAAGPAGSIGYTCDPNISAIGGSICSTLNTQVAGLYAAAFTNATANIYVRLGVTNLGESLYSTYVASYSGFRNAVVASQSGADDITAVAGLPLANPFGVGSVDLTNANARALGFSPSYGLDVSGNFCTLGSGGCYDGIITVSSSVQAAGNFYYRSGNINANQYDFYTTVEHETDEILGTASCAFGCGGDVAPADLFRYQSDKARSPQQPGNNSSCSSATGGNACFSIDGSIMLHQYNNLNNGDDPGDWLADPSCAAAFVQDATLCSGYGNVDISPVAEIRVLDVIGYTTKPVGVLGAGADGKLYSVVPVTGGTTAIGALPSVMTGLASSNGSLYGIAKLAGGNSALYSINPSTGAGTQLSSSIQATLNALAFSPSGTLYAAGGSSLYAIDTNTGVGALGGSGTYVSSGGLQFDAAGNLYLTSSTNGGQLYSVNGTTGVGTVVGSLGVSGSMSLVYSSGIMFGFSGAGKLFTINLATGAATPSGTYSPVLTGATAYISSAILTISSSHNGNFAAGRQGATFTVVVSNVSANASIGNVTVTENLPNGLSLVSMSGAGWICTADTCTRNDPLAGGGSYAAINVIVNVSTNAASPQVNSVTVSGGGSGTATATDSVTITGSGASLSAVKSHAGTFSRGQQGAAYAVTVSNAQGSGATTGAVTVSEIVPTGLTLVSMSGAGWNCPSGGSSCTRSDALSGGGSYPAIAVTVNVAASAPGQVINQVQVTGGGSNPASAADTTAIGAGQTIAFGPLSSVIYGAAPFAAKATASSGLPVLLTSTTPAVCVAAGDLVTILNAGTCSIRATQVGNAVFGAAAPVVRSFGVNQAGAGGQLTQAPGSPISVGKGPQSLAAGDFNGDGIQDLAIANNQDGTVTVLLGNGSGGFSQAPGSPVAAGPLPTSVAVGDFNGDGIPDLAVADNYRGNILEVSILLGNGQGRFTAAPLIQYFASGPPGALAVGDFNRDGFPDLALVNELGNNVTILLGDGSGGFAQAAGSPFAVGGQPTALVAADFNSDGVPDLAVTNSADNTVTVLLGDGTGAFTPAAGSPYSTGAFPFSIALADLNADGVPDLAIAANNGLTIMIGNGSGGFTASTSKTSVGINPIYVAVGDFNGDGKQDLAVVALVTIGPSEYANVLLLPGNGSGGISLTPLSSLTLYQAGNGSAVFGLGVGDFNGDGIEDVSVASYATNNVDILLGTTLTSQSIAFGPLSNVTLPAAAITLSAIASSGLPVLFASTTPSVCAVSGNVLTIVAAGTCSVQATQAGNASYSAATPVNQSFQVTASAQAAFFSGQVSLSNGVYFLQFSNGKAFGYYTYLTSSIIYHYDMGYEAFVPAASGSDAYLYDFATGHWFYTSQAFFPYLYDFTLKTWIYYFPNTTSPGHYTTGPRYFSNLTTGQIFTM